MKKILLTLGVVAVIGTPIITVVSCGATKSSIRNRLNLHDESWLTKNGFHFVETKTETVAFSFNKQDYIKYEIWKDDKGNVAHREI